MFYEKIASRYDLLNRTNLRLVFNNPKTETHKDQNNHEDPGDFLKLEPFRVTTQITKLVVHEVNKHCYKE